MSDQGLFLQLRQLINAVDELRDVGLSHYINLPRICVVGTQSAGKSSLLEAIVGMNFLPRGEGVVTRRPLEMRLVNDPELKEAQMYATFDGIEKITDFDKVKKRIDEMTNEVAGHRKGIVDDPITMSIYGKAVPDLTLIDLPGITRVPLTGSDQTEEVEKVTKGMVYRYAEDERTVILAVMPANQDISTSDSLQIARRLDPKGIRTLGVITKIDLMDSGTNASDMLRGKLVPLRLGYVGVKLRSQQEVASQLSVAESWESERIFFEQHPVYRHLPPTMLGSKNLTAKLSKVLFRHIRHCLPDIKSEIGNRKSTVANRLQQLGTGPPSSEQEMAQMVWTLVTDYCECLKNTIRGKYDRRLSTYLGDGQIGGGAEVRAILNGLLENEYKRDVTEDLSDYDIDRALRHHEGDSLPGFPSPDTFEYLLLPYMQTVQEPVYDCLDRVAGTLDNMSQLMLERIFQRFPALAERVSYESTGILAKQKQITKDILHNIVLAETGYLFTNDETYLIRHAQMGPILPTKSGQSQAPQHPAAPVMQAPPQEQNMGQRTVLSVKSFGNQVSSYIKTGTENVSETFAGGPQPMYSREFLSEIRTRLNGYFRIVIRNLRDAVPKTIGYFLVRSIQDSLQYELYQTLTREEKLNELLSEPPTIKEEREELRNQEITLTRASQILQKDLLGPGLADVAGFDEMYERDLKEVRNETGLNEKLVVKPEDSILHEKQFVQTASRRSGTPVQSADDDNRTPDLTEPPQAAPKTERRKSLFG